MEDVCVGGGGEKSDRGGDGKRQGRVCVGGGQQVWDGWRQGRVCVCVWGRRARGGRRRASGGGGGEPGAGEGMTGRDEARVGMGGALKYGKAEGGGCGAGGDGRTCVYSCVCVCYGAYSTCVLTREHVCVRACAAAATPPAPSRAPPPAYPPQPPQPPHPKPPKPHSPDPPGLTRRRGIERERPAGVPPESFTARLCVCARARVKTCVRVEGGGSAAVTPFKAWLDPPGSLQGPPSRASFDQFRLPSVGDPRHLTRRGPSRAVLRPG